jgi:murein DD-endopeptidase MepM/ murein hydrolase activator NlpD
MSILARQHIAPFVSTRSGRLFGVVGLCLSLVVALALTSLAPSQAFGQSKNDSLKKAKAAVALAKKEADAAAQEYAVAFGAFNKLSDRLSEVQAQLDNAESSMSTLQSKASNQAKDAYIRSSSEDVDQEYSDVVDEHRRTQLLATVSEFDDAQLTQLVGLKEDLAISRDELAELKEDRRKGLDDLSKQKKALSAKLNEAAKAQKALETKLAREAKAKAKTARSASSGSTKSSGSPGQIINPGGGAQACPVQGSIAFTNDWGRPRSGGRTHKGTDIFAPRGTPNVAVVDGRVMFRNEGTGGLTAYVSGNNGVTYYYAHLDSTVGGARSVKRGEVIGRTGNTGNASGGATHTHFEIRPGGGGAVNPYSTLRSIC